MGYAQESGYEPASIQTILNAIMAEINTQFSTTYTAETFVGTNWYKFSYAVAQRMQENEVKTSEIFLKLQDYFASTNEFISRPVVTNPGLIEALALPTTLMPDGYVASVKKPIDADAGKVYVCVDLDSGDPDFAAQKLEVATIIKNSTVAGVVSQGAQSTAIVLSNGQSFDFKFALPNVITPLLKLTITTSENNQSVILTPTEIKALLMANIAEKYALGKNFEPQKYFNLVDAPWASSVVLEYKIGVGAWTTTFYDANFDDLFDILLANITLVEL